MEISAIGEIPRDGYAFGGKFPFRLGWQALSGPFGIRVGLEVADVADGLGGIEAAQAVERKNRPDSLLVRQ